MTLTARRVTLPDPSWYDEAACRGMDIDIFFPPVGDVDAAAAAKAICATCPVVDECLITAVIKNDKCGVFGGTCHKERRKLRLAWGIAEPRTPRAET